MEDTRWLDEEEGRIWRSFIEAHARVVHALDQALKQQSGLSIDDYEVLVVLSEAPAHRMRMVALSERLLHSQSRLTQRVDRLVKRGWVRREPCQDDRRGTLALLTAEGLAVLESAAPGHVGRVRSLVIDLIEPDERAVMARVLAHITAAARHQ
jgi:DNA-binding MarR family transcriptional regulator